MEMAMIESAVRRRGARIISAAGEGTESDDPSSILMRRMIDAFAEYERLIIGARTKGALAAKRRRGEKCGGHAPFGYGLAPDGKTLAPCQAEQKVIALVRQLREQGETLQAIAATLNSRGIQRREGGRWDHQFISRLLKRAA
jgi:DNA invertase Pin-like site-specific DNA recombinase